MEQLVRHIRSNHITVLLETRVSNLAPLIQHLPSHTQCYHNTVLNEGRKGQGVAIFVHNSVRDLVQLCKISESLQAVWLTIHGSVFGVMAKVVLGGIYINPQSSYRSHADIAEMFSLLQLELVEVKELSQHIIILGDFNAHLGQEIEPVTQQFAPLLEKFPQLLLPRLNPYQHSKLNAAGQCLLDMVSSTPLFLTTGRGKGDSGQATYFGYHTSPALIPSRTEHVAMTPELYTRCQDIRVIQRVNMMDHKPLKCHFVVGDLNHIDLRLPTYAKKSKHESKLVWNGQAAEQYVENLVTDDATLDLFKQAIHERLADTAYTHLVHLIEHAARVANMISRRRPYRAIQNLPMAPWFDDTCKNLKAQIRHLAKHRQPITNLKHAYNSYCRKRSRAYKKVKAQEVVNLIESRDVQAYKLFHERKCNCQTPVPAHVWTEYLHGHFVQDQTGASGGQGLLPKLPPSHQVLSNRLRSRQTAPSDLADSPGPGGRFRQGPSPPITSAAKQQYSFLLRHAFRINSELLYPTQCVTHEC